MYTAVVRRFCIPLGLFWVLSACGSVSEDSAEHFQATPVVSARGTIAGCEGRFEEVSRTAFTGTGAYILGRYPATIALRFDTPASADILAERIGLPAKSVPAGLGLRLDSCVGLARSFAPRQLRARLIVDDYRSDFRFAGEYNAAPGGSFSGFSKTSRHVGAAVSYNAQQEITFYSASNHAFLKIGREQLREVNGDYVYVAPPSGLLPTILRPTSDMLVSITSPVQPVGGSQSHFVMALRILPHISAWLDTL